MVTETGRLTAPITSVAAADIVMSPDATRLYVAGEDGKVRVYDVASRSLIATWDVGVRLAGIDVSLDGSFLIVAERQPNGAWGEDGIFRSSSIVYKVATASGAVSTFSLPATGNSYNFFDVAMLADGSVLVSQEVYSGWLPLWTLDLASGSFTPSTETYSTRGRLTRSADATQVLFTPGDSSLGEIHVWESGRGVTHSSDSPFDSTDGYNAGVQAISLATDRIVQFTSWDANLYDGELNFLGALPLTGMLVANVSAAVFDPTGTYLYLLSDDDDLIYQLATADWSVVRTFAVGADVGGGWLGAFGNRLQISPDGRYFMVMTSDGVRLVENDGLDNSFSGTEGADLLAGGAGNDWLHGRGGDDDLDGGSGDDSLAGAEGDDIVRGGAGNDTLNVWGAGADVVEGGAGGRDNLLVAWDDATTAITMTMPAVDPGGGFTGSISGDGRSLDYSGIEIFSITTGSGDDLLWGGADHSAFANVRNFYNLGDGNDLFFSLGGTDTVDAGTGVDGFSGTMAGGPIFWSLQPTAFPGVHSFYTNFEYFKSLTTGSGQDSITTANLNLDDSLTLGAGGDSAILWNGHDIVNGGAAGAGATDSGLDTLILNYGSATSGVHNGGALTGNAAGYSGQFNDGGTRSATFEAIDRFLIVTGAGADAIVTGNGNDEVRTAGGNDVIASGGGNDLLDGGSGDDSMTGGAGNDIYVVTSAGDTVVEAAGEGTDEVRTGLATYSLAALAHVENLAATSGAAHDFRGNAGNNVVTGGAGNDVLRLYDGGDDTVLAGAGSDNIFFIGSLTAADVINGGSETDTLVLQGPYGALTLTANITEIENVSMLGGNNTNFGEPGTNRYDYVLTTHDANFAAGLQVRINGAALLEGEDFTFNGSAETNAHFVVFGGKGVDTLTGGLGHDIFFYAEERFATGDTVNGGAGYDGMFLRGNYTIDFNAPGYTGLFTNIENLTLTSATDERYARGGGTEFDYNLTLSNAIVKPGETLTVSGALLMATETMILDASQEADGFLRLFGGRASDTLKGGANADLIHGNLGGDILTGNGGADTFRYDSTAESSFSSTDQITDFTPGTDKVDLSRIDASSLVAGDQAFAWIGSGAFSGQAGQLRASAFMGNAWILEGDTNGDAQPDLFLVLALQGPTPLSAGDFIL